MTATTLTSTLDAEFEPTGATFCLDVRGGSASLLRSNTAGGTFTPVGTVTGVGVIIDNGATGSVYKLSSISPSAPTVLAYE